MQFRPIFAFGYRQTVFYIIVYFSRAKSVLIHIFTNPSAQVGYGTRSIFLSGV